MKEAFLKARHQLANQLPFVLYRQPKSNELQAFFLANPNAESIDFSRSGFCMFPFDKAKRNYFFDIEKSDYKKFYITDNELTIPAKESNTLSEENEDEKRRYIQLIAESIHHLKQGDYKKIVLSRPIRIEAKNKDALEVFQKLLPLYLDAMVYIWYHPVEGVWIGATPETLVDYKQSQLKTMALAGTRVHQKETQPTWTEKEIEEQALVSEYIQNKLSAFSQSLSVSNTYNKQAGNVVHLNTDITARIPPKELEQVILDLHPTPAVCGLPTEKAKQYIMQHEGYNRLFYTGFLGEINMPKQTIRAKSKRNQEVLAIQQRSKQSHLYVNLRCMNITKDYFQLFVGGGITSSSNPTDEWIETREKSQTLLKVL